MSKMLHEGGEIRLGVECCIKFGSSVLLQKRSPSSKFFPGFLTFPGGHVDVGEDARTACIREVVEETGLDISKFDVKFIISSINTHQDKKVVWVIYGFRVELESKEVPISTSEGECAWYDLSTLNLNEVVPPVRDYFGELVNSHTPIFTSGLYNNGVVVTSKTA